MTLDLRAAREQFVDMRNRADAWLNDHVSGKRITRDNALCEEHLALDVIELLALVEELQAARDELQRGLGEALRHLDGVGDECCVALSGRLQTLVPEQLRAVGRAK